MKIPQELIAEYSRSLAVPVYEVGQGNKLKLGSVLRLVQETSEQHLRLLHISYEELRGRGNLVFFIISTRVKVHRMPMHAEPITIKTHPRGRNGVQFYRDYEFYDANGSLLIEVMQTTVLADAATHKLQRPQALKPFWDYPEQEIPPEERIERFRVPEGLPLIGVRAVYRSDLDANGHMNNCVYGDIVADCLPKSMLKTLSTVQINYLLETEEGDHMTVCAARQQDGGLFLMRGENSHGLSFTASARTKEKPVQPQHNDKANQ